MFPMSQEFSENPKSIDIRGHHLPLAHRIYQENLLKNGYQVTADGVFKDGKQCLVNDPQIFAICLESENKSQNAIRAYSEKDASRLGEWFDITLNSLTSIDDLRKHQSIHKCNALQYVVRNKAFELGLNPTDLPEVFINFGSPASQFNRAFYDANTEVTRTLYQYILQHKNSLKNEMHADPTQGIGYFYDTFEKANPENNPDITALNEYAKKLMVLERILFLTAPKETKTVVKLYSDGICRIACIIGGKHCAINDLNTPTAPSTIDSFYMDKLENFLSEKKLEFMVHEKETPGREIHTSLGNVRAFTILT